MLTLKSCFCNRLFHSDALLLRLFHSEFCFLKECLNGSKRFGLFRENWLMYWIQDKKISKLLWNFDGLLFSGYRIRICKKRNPSVRRSSWKFFPKRLEMFLTFSVKINPVSPRAQFGSQANQPGAWRKPTRKFLKSKKKMVNAAKTLFLGAENPRHEYYLSIALFEYPKDGEKI